jgi:hypothetical protein
VRHLSIPAEKTGRTELLPLWAGQSANLSRCTDVHALLDKLVNEVSHIGSQRMRKSNCVDPRTGESRWKQRHNSSDVHFV